MKTIWKYDIPIEANFEITMPRNAKFLSIQVQFDKPVVWYLVDTNEKETKRIFKLFGTGHTIIDDNWLKYRGTFQTIDGTFIGHVFEDITNLKDYS